MGGRDGAGWMRTGGAKGKNGVTRSKVSVTVQLPTENQEMLDHLKGTLTFAYEMRLVNCTLLKARQGEAMEEGGAALFKFLFHIKVTILPRQVHNQFMLFTQTINCCFTAFED